MAPRKPCSTGCGWRRGSPGENALSAAMALFWSRAPSIAASAAVMRSRSAAVARSAASAAAAGSMIERTSWMASSSVRFGSRPASQPRTSRSSRLQSARGRTWVPWRGRTLTSPLAASVLIASRTTPRPTPKRASSSCSGGSAAPTAIAPCAISPPSARSTRWMRPGLGPGLARLPADLDRAGFGRALVDFIGRLHARPVVVTETHASTRGFAATIIGCSIIACCAAERIMLIACAAAARRLVAFRADVGFDVEHVADHRLVMVSAGLPSAAIAPGAAPRCGRRSAPRG